MGVQLPTGRHPFEELLLHPDPHCLMEQGPSLNRSSDELEIWTFIKNFLSFKYR